MAKRKKGKRKEKVEEAGGGIKISDDILGFIERKVRELGFELYDLEVKDSGRRIIIRVYIDRPDRFIGIQDCVRVSRGIENQLESMIERSFVLEVSSPGADRELKTEHDFERFKGMKVEVIKKSGGKVRGKLMGKIKDEVFVRTEEGRKGGKIISFPLSEIDKVKLCP